ncbi:MAG: electron transfer flavoprotein subunit alpha/FixB family protein [Clostridia bacterium]|nr:electron transfer flavoprotein subunit alpha/FixB family protein [Clostridia bacterium]
MTIIVFCEKKHPAGQELLFKARSMAPEARITALHEDEDAGKYFLCGADTVLFLGEAEDDCAQGSRIAEALEREAPDMVLFPATVRGRFLSAWAAAKLHTGLTADCTELSITENGLLLQTRPAYGGSFTASILCPEKRPQMASVRPGVFPLPAGGQRPANAHARNAQCPMPEALMRLIDAVPTDNPCPLQQAKVIVAGGKGVGGKEGFALLFELARLLGGAVGATRSAVDEGWIPYAHQIGQTGITVRPTLYMSFGISGMIQHLVGMRGAKYAVAVNTDRNAPIFRAADYGIVAPWRETAAYMIRFIKERKGIQ